MPITPNERETIAAADQISGEAFYVEGTASTGAINVNLAGSAGTIDSNITEIGGAPITLGQKTMANSLPVVIASDQAPFVVSDIEDGSGDSIMDAANDAMRVNIVAGGAGNGAILDFVTPTIGATVFDYTNSNPLGVVLRDTNGDYVSVGGGTQYAIDTVAGAADVGNLALVVRDDVLTTLTPADGDYTQMRTTSTGRLWTSAVIDTALPAGTNSIGTLGANSGIDIGDVTVNNASGAAAVNIQDGGNSITVDQPTGSNLHTVIDSGTLTAVTSITNALPAGNNVIGHVITDTGSTTAVTGTVTVTATNLSTNIAQVNGATVNVGTGAASTGTQRVTTSTDSTIGTVTTVSAITAVGTITPGTAASSLGKAEDAAHTSGDVGVFALGVRNDAGATAGSNTNGDYTQLSTDANGRTIITSKTATATLSNVAGSATSVTLIASNTDRLGATIVNDSSVNLYVKFGSTASATSYTVKMVASAYYEVPYGYTGIITGIWDSATGNARVMESTS